MVIRQKNDQLTSPQYRYISMQEGTVKSADANPSALVLQVSSYQDAGIKRKDRPNEDTLLITQGVLPSDCASPFPCSQSFALFLVADGMGGLAHGQEASRIAAQSLREYVLGSLRSRHLMPDAFLSLLAAGVRYANERVYQHHKVRQTMMGTTMTAVLVVASTAYVAHVGDSRLYLYRKPLGLVQVTHDHSLVAALVAAGTIQPEDIYSHPLRSQIYRCLGAKTAVDVETHTVPLAAGDTLLLCSDGLWEMVRDQQIATILTLPLQNPSSTTYALVQAALAGGGDDNVSVLVVRVSAAETHCTE